MKSICFLNYITACDDGMYGANCSQNCGDCLGNEACHHINGSCLTGCDKGYHAQKCDEGSLLYSVPKLSFSPLSQGI